MCALLAPVSVAVRMSDVVSGRGAIALNLNIDLRAERERGRIRFSGSVYF